jgi:large subunit ribosomal protein L35
MNKLKSHRGAHKRFKVTATGKILRKKASASHLLTRKPRSRKRRLRKAVLVSSADAKRLQTRLG